VVREGLEWAAHGEQKLASAARAWRPADSSGRRGARGGGLQGGEQSRDWGEDDTWSSSQQEVARRRRQSGGQRRRTAPAAGEGRAEHVLGEEEERGGRPGDLFGIFKKFRDLSVKKDFPLI
jgi:hypothetical protein